MSNIERLRHEIAADIHKIWVLNNPGPQMRCPNGGRASQGKCSNEEQIDIAVDYDNLTPFWQGANNKAVDVALKAYTLFPDNRDGAGNYIHEEWMKNNDWERSSRPQLFVPFSELPVDEQEKDLKHYDIIKRYVDNGDITSEEINDYLNKSGGKRRYNKRRTLKKGRKIRSRKSRSRKSRSRKSISRK